MSPLAKRLWTKSENNCLTFGLGELLRRLVSLAGQDRASCVIVFQTCKLEMEAATMR